ncbi:hypothetical protein E1091_01575 [Micromonospora fluostatini]|uniref:S1 family peptidase n=1 Tax=Micromonospora fluostatini TaxID=1629071 RepID=A0ABY2DMD3_9ACTN|nr:hypothetical protein E1091_01575 [Micromonospora fluostatini]
MRQTQQRRRVAAVGLIAALLIPFGPGATAQADDPQPVDVPGGFATWEALFDEQTRLNDSVDAIQTAAATAGDTGYASAIVDPTARAVQLFWRGTPSAAVQAAITTQRQNVPISLGSTAHNEATLVAEAERIGASSTRFAGAAPAPNGSGVVVTWLEGQIDPATAEATVAGSPVPVSFSTQTEIAPPQPTSRQNDASPYKGGARVSGIDDECSTAFGVNTNTHGSALLFAAHCGNHGETIRDGGGQVVGTVAKVSTGMDTSVIVASSQGRVWDGGPQSNYHKAVAKAQPTRVSNYICTSGAFSGTRCGGKITQINFTSGSLNRVSIWEHPGRQAMYGHGDSGGPVYATTSNNKVVAQGIISAGAGGRNAPCVGEATPPCYWRGYIADIMLTLQNKGATIKTA